MSKRPSPPSLIRAIASPRMGICVLTGFSSGMPLYVLEQLVPAWLRSESVDLETIGWLYLATLPYTCKPLWAAFMDRYAPPIWGRRRGWALVTQLALLCTLASMALLDPAGSLRAIGVAMFLTSFASASQDIVLDAYRREILDDRELGLGSSVFVQAYRVSALVPGSLGLILADQLSWSSAQWIVAAFMGVGLATTCLMPEPPRSDGEVGPRGTLETLWAPIREFFERRGPRSAWTILAFLLLYKLGDSMASALVTPFYLDLGFTNTQIGSIAKVAGLGAGIVGGLVGGLLMLRLGIDRALWIFGGLQMVSTLGFAALSEIGPDPLALGAVVAFEYLGVGMGGAAFVAFIQRASRPPYTGAQLALLTSLLGVPRTFFRSGAGTLIETLGYTPFFVLCTLLALPGMLLLRRVAPWSRRPAAGLEQRLHE